MVSAPNIFGGHLRQVLFACTIYAALFVIALFIEIAYEFETFKNLVFALMIPVFLWILLTLMSSLFVCWKLAEKSISVCFVTPIMVFPYQRNFAAFFPSVHFFPKGFITKANFQTYPAPAAYLKNVFYFLPLGVFLIILPFGAINWLEKQSFKDGSRRTRLIYFCCRANNITSRKMPTKL